MYTGHYIVLTLFLAVILEAFESAYDENTEAEVIVADVVTRAALQRAAPLKSAMVKPGTVRKVSGSGSWGAVAVPHSFSVSKQHAIVLSGQDCRGVGLRCCWTGCCILCFSGGYRI